MLGWASLSALRARFTERTDENWVAGLGGADLRGYALRISGKLKPRSTASNSDPSARPGSNDAWLFWLLDHTIERRMERPTRPSIRSVNVLGSGTNETSEIEIH